MLHLQSSFQAGQQVPCGHRVRASRWDSHRAGAQVRAAPLPSLLASHARPHSAAAAVKVPQDDSSLDEFVREEF